MKKSKGTGKTLKTSRIEIERLQKDKLRAKRRLENLEELNKLKSEFISAVSHELRTPLAIINQLVMLIYNKTAGTINQKQKEILRRTVGNIERLTSFIDKLLDISMIESKRLKLTYSLINLNELLKESADFFRRVAKEKSIRLSYHIPRKDINIFIDVDRIKQVILNLINNAIKFTEKGGYIKVEVKVLETKVRIGVIDTGMGISENNLPYVFDKFIQVSKGESKGRKGVGLGLAIAKELVQKHNGEIWIESKIGKGSQLYFTLPLFYSYAGIDKNIKNKIEEFIDQGVIVHFINILIVHYSEFKGKLKGKFKKLFDNIKGVIDNVLRGVYQTPVDRYPLVIESTREGKYSIILPGISVKKALKISTLLKDKVKSYVVENKIEDVFVALGILSYPKQMRSKIAKELTATVQVKEICIGSEMRLHKRLPCSVKVKLIFPKAKSEVTKTIDISKGGICVIVKRPLKTNSYLEIELMLSGGKKMIKSLVHVAWIKKIEGVLTAGASQCTVGLEFVNLENKYQRIISKELEL